MATRRPTVGDFVASLSRREMDLALSGHLTHVALDKPVRRGILFLAYSDQIVAVANCRAASLVWSVSDWHLRYPEHRNRSEFMPYAKTYLSELYNVRQLDPALGLAGGPANNRLTKLGKKAILGSGRSARPHGEDIIGDDGGPRTLSALCQSPDTAARVASARARGASRLEASLGAGAVPSVSNSELSDQQSEEHADVPAESSEVRKRPAAYDIRAMFARQKGNTSDTPSS